MIDRVVYINQLVGFDMVFRDEDNNLVEPLTPALYPNYMVKDINNEVVAFGVGTLDSVDKVYKGEFVVPSDAKLSTPKHKWKVEWELLASNGKKYNAREFFDVTHPQFGEIDLKEQQKLTLSSSPCIITLPLPAIPESQVFDVVDGRGGSVLSNGLTPQEYGTYGDNFLYTATIPPNTMAPNNIYNVVWKFTLPGSFESVYYKKLICTDIMHLQQISDLRMYLDKVLKPLDQYTGYRDSDLYFYLQEGLAHLNMITPLTTWTHVSFSGTMSMFLPLWSTCACWVALQSQYLAEADQAFNYSGQAVQLDVDRTGYIDSQLGRLESFINERIPQIKKQLIHGMQGFHLQVTWPSVSPAMTTQLNMLGRSLRQMMRFQF